MNQRVPPSPANRLITFEACSRQLVPLCVPHDLPDLLHAAPVTRRTHPSLQSHGACRRQPGRAERMGGEEAAAHPRTVWRTPVTLSEATTCSQSSSLQSHQPPEGVGARIHGPRRSGPRPVESDSRLCLVEHDGEGTSAADLQECRRASESLYKFESHNPT